MQNANDTGFVNACQTIEFVYNSYAFRFIIGTANLSCPEIALQKINTKKVKLWRKEKESFIQKNLRNWHWRHII